MSLSKKIKAILLDKLSQYRGQKVALGLSSGIDSNAVLLILKELSVRVHAYSFCLDGRSTEDVWVARKNADRLGVDFTPVFLPSNIRSLMDDVAFLIHSVGLEKKTMIECLWCLLHMSREVKEETIILGLGIDSLFANAKGPKLQFRFNLDRLNAYRQAKIKNVRTQLRILNQQGHGKKFVGAYDDDRLVDAFSTVSWDEANRGNPRKAPLYRMFNLKDEPPISINPPMNFQCGDSGIREHFAKLMDTEWRPPTGTTVISLYNHVRKNRLGNPKESVLWQPIKSCQEVSGSSTTR